MAESKMTISWEELHSRPVEDKLQQAEAISLAREQYLTAPPPDPLLRHRRRSFHFLYNSLVYLSLFGLLGAILGWSISTLVEYRPSPQWQAVELSDALQRLESSEYKDVGEKSRAAAAAEGIRQFGRKNAYFQILQNQSITPEERSARTKSLIARDRRKQFISDVFVVAICSALIAFALSGAESFVQRNFRYAASIGAVAAAVGFVAGVLAGPVLEMTYSHLAGTSLLKFAGGAQLIISRTISWGIVGLLIGVAPGVALWSTKKAWIGAVGGCAGGIVGGLLFDPVATLVESPAVGRLVATIFIGTVAGVAIAMADNIAKSGWLRVTKGLIAGKQFVLYRNPTYLGSAPQCQIFLFKDPQVGRRHAAVHLVPNGFEIEDLPLGAPTLVNGRPITRARLRTGDKIQVGSSIFTFEEKPRTVKTGK